MAKTQLATKKSENSSAGLVLPPTGSLPFKVASDHVPLDKSEASPENIILPSGNSCASPRSSCASPRYSCASPRYSCASPRYSCASPQYSCASPQYSCASPRYSCASPELEKKRSHKPGFSPLQIQAPNLVPETALKQEKTTAYPGPFFFSNRHRFLSLMNGVFQKLHVGFNRIESFPGTLPRSIASCQVPFLLKGYYFSLKADGVRKFLMLFRKGCSTWMVTVDRKIEHRLVPLPALPGLAQISPTEKVSLTVFDTEEVKLASGSTVFLVFDVLVCSPTPEDSKQRSEEFLADSVVYNSFQNRLELVKTAFKNLRAGGNSPGWPVPQEVQELACFLDPEYGSLHGQHAGGKNAAAVMVGPSTALVIKPFFPLRRMQAVPETHFSNKNFSWDTVLGKKPGPGGVFFDGLVFCLATDVYHPGNTSVSSCLKWKPFEKITIDFKVVRMDHSKALQKYRFSPFFQQQGPHRQSFCQQEICRMFQQPSALSSGTKKAPCSQEELLYFHQLNQVPWENFTAGCCKSSREDLFLFVTTQTCPRNSLHEKNPQTKSFSVPFATVPESVIRPFLAGAQEPSKKRWSRGVKEEEELDCGVFEFRWREWSSGWVPVSRRQDKTYGNSLQVVLKTIESLWNPVHSQELIEVSRVSCM